MVFLLDIGVLVRLVELNLAANKLSSLPDAITTLVSLKHLDLCRNQFTLFPISICQMSSLEMLDLSCNALARLPETFNWPNMLHLYLQGNKLDVLPPALCRLTSLRELNVTCNALECLPNELTVLGDTVEAYERVLLYAEGNPFTGLPPRLAEVYQPWEFWPNMCTFLRAQAARAACFSRVKVLVVGSGNVSVQKYIFSRLCTTFYAE